MSPHGGVPRKQGIQERGSPATVAPASFGISGPFPSLYTAARYSVATACSYSGKKMYRRKEGSQTRWCHNVASGIAKLRTSARRNAAQQAERNTPLLIEASKTVFRAATKPRSAHLGHGLLGGSPPLGFLLNNNNNTIQRASGPGEALGQLERWELPESFKVCSWVVWYVAPDLAQASEFQSSANRVLVGICGYTP